MKFMELDAKQKQKALDDARTAEREAAEYVARLEQLQVQEQAEDERTDTETASRELMNAEDNATALMIAGVEAETKKETSVKTGEGVTNPRPRTDT